MPNTTSPSGRSIGPEMEDILLLTNPISNNLQLPFYTEFEKLVSAEASAREVSEGIKSVSTRIPCNREIGTETFILQSPGYPKEYPNDVDCIVIVYPSSNDICALELRFDEFNVEPSALIDECGNDYLEISDGDDKDTTR